MARRPVAGRGDPSIRAAIVESRRQLAQAMPGAFVEAVRAAVDGEPLELSTAELGRAMIRADHPDWRLFTFPQDTKGERLWLLTVDDVLRQVAP
jgi:hypothetical protein